MKSTQLHIIYSTWLLVAILWHPVQGLTVHGTPSRASPRLNRTRFQAFWGFSLAPPRTSLATKSDDSIDDSLIQQTRKARRQIVVTAEEEMNIPIEIAYDAFRDLPRQPSWSPWLRSVEYLSDDKNESLWRMKYLGLTISWKAINTNLERPYLIEWESTSGLKNYGRVEFERLSAQNTRMRFVMTFEAPRMAAAMIGKSSSVTRMVENKMLKKTLRNFRRIVTEHDLKRDPVPVAQETL